MLEKRIVLFRMEILSEKELFLIRIDFQSLKEDVMYIGQNAKI